MPAVPPPLPEEPHRSEDAQIREAGFRIQSRPKDGPARWRRGRVVYTQGQALLTARRERQEKLAQLEKAHG